MLITTSTIDFSAIEAAQQTLQLCRRRLTSPGATPIHARIAPCLIVRASSHVTTTNEDPSTSPIKSTT